MWFKYPDLQWYSSDTCHCLVSLTAPTYKKKTKKKPLQPKTNDLLGGSLAAVRLIQSRITFSLQSNHAGVPWQPDFLICSQTSCFGHCEHRCWVLTYSNNPHWQGKHTRVPHKQCKHYICQSKLSIRLSCIPAPPAWKLQNARKGFRQEGIKPSLASFVVCGKQARPAFQVGPQPSTSCLQDFFFYHENANVNCK